MQKPGQYSVAVYTTPMSFPLHFTVHSWVEISNGFKTIRYDFWAYPGMKTNTAKVGYIYENIFPRHLGTTFSPIIGAGRIEKRQVGTKIAEISGGTNSSAHQLFLAIRKNAFRYPAYDRYNMILGPNCNTYTQWLLQLVPEAGMTLPWHAWGKNKNV